jgi:hypothetical protein
VEDLMKTQSISGIKDGQGGEVWATLTLSNGIKLGIIERESIDTDAPIVNDAEISGMSANDAERLGAALIQWSAMWRAENGE